MKLYCVVDRKVKTVVNIFASENDEMALRSFQHLLTSPQDTVFNLSPEDFSLYHFCDLEYVNGFLSVGEPNMDVVRDNGFKAGFQVAEYLKNGGEFGYDFLNIERKRRVDSMNFVYSKSTSSEEVSNES